MMFGRDEIQELAFLYNRDLQLPEFVAIVTEYENAHQLVYIS